jgi:hypothetical protein
MSTASFQIRKKQCLFLLAAGLLFGAFGPVQAYVDNSRYDLERSRNSLLDRRDALLRNYQNLLSQNDDLNRKLNDIQQRIKYTYSDIRKTDGMLTDLDYALKQQR